MKTKAALVALFIACLGLGIGLIVVNNNADSRQKADAKTIAYLSNSWTTTEEQRAGLEKVRLDLEKDAAARKADISKLSNDLAQATDTLSQKDLALKVAAEETAKRDAKIADLENQNETLDKKTADLKGNIGQLEVQIADTQKKLSASEGDKAFLEKELHRLMDEKAELERQFNDLAALKQRVQQLRAELNVARRVEWMRQGVFASADQKGAQKLMQGPNGATLTPAGNKAYDMNVEVRTDGSVQVIPPISTNNPPQATDPPATIK
jgi:septal ring factor EnvC (AmiA/AmiB activator)